MPAGTSSLDAARESSMAATSPARPSPWWFAGAIIAAAAALAAGMLLNISSGNGPGATVPGAENPVDVGFARDMRDHHAQAVEMSVMVRDATDDPQVRTLALDVMLTQQQQLGQMFGWLNAWGYPQAGAVEPMSWMVADDMAGMDHSSPDDPSPQSAGDIMAMPGMATEAQLRKLERSRGLRAERLYLQLMIPHHMAAVDMARFALENATQPQVRQLAESIDNSQTAELDVLRSMLADRGGPVPDL